MSELFSPSLNKSFIPVWSGWSLISLSYLRGLVHYTDLLPLLRQIDPPLGFGSKCPDLLAYKRLVRMNMPVDEEGKVHFKSTLFSLIRINLQIFMRSMEEMDQADQELRAAIQKSWPITRGGTPPMVDLLVPPPEETGPGKLTVGKIYGGMLILENWKLSRFGQGFNNNKNNAHSNNISVRNTMEIFLSPGHKCDCDFLQNGGSAINNNNLKNLNQNEGKTLMDAPVPSPTKEAVPVSDEAVVSTGEPVTTTATATTTVAGGGVTTDCVMSNVGSLTKGGGAVPTQSQNGSITHTQKAASLSQGQKPPSLMNGQKPPSLLQGQSQKPPSLTGGQKPPSVPGSFTQGQQQPQPFQPTLPQLPEPLIPMSHPIDTKQEIVENYLNSLPPPATNGINLSNGSRMPIDISSSLAEGEPSLNQLMNGHGGRYRGVSVDRYREYQPPGYYEENYYKRDPYDSSGEDRMTSYGKYDSLPGRYKGGAAGAGAGYQKTDLYDEFDEPLSGGEERLLPKRERQWRNV